MLLNKVNLELSGNRSFGNINQNVYLDAGKVPAAVKQQVKASEISSKPAEKTMVSEEK